MRKRFVTAMLAGCLCLGVVGCSADRETALNSAGETSSEASLDAATEENTLPEDASAVETTEEAATAAQTSAEEPSEEENSEAERTTAAGLVLPAESDTESGEEIAFEEQGRARIDYTGNRSSVRYITSADALAGQEELAQFDDVFFAEHALVLVAETVSSGSVDVGIQSINSDGTTATVTLYHELAADAVGTDDMATWLLWAVVEKDMRYSWMVANPALEPDAVQY